MSLTKSFRNCAAVAGAALAVTLAAAPASAESLFFDWGSNESVNDSGREIVNFENKARPGELIVSFGDRRVYYVVAPGKALSYPIAVPREKSKWAGVTSVSQKRVSPSWTPTPEMIRENPRLPPWVPGGHPMNPLGTHALYLGSSAYRIHGTDAPWTIGTAASKGCVRMYNKDVQDLYPRVPVGTKVTVTYQTYKFSPLDGDSSKGILAGLDKGRKIKASDDVAASAVQATKKWRGDDSGDGAPADKSTARDSEAGDNDSDGKSAEKNSTGKAGSEKSADAIIDMEADAPIERRKRNGDKRAVETGSVDATKDMREPGSKSDAIEAQEKSETKAKFANKDKANTAPAKPAASEASSAIANRALAAAERAAAAAERAADAAERASVAAIKASSRYDGEAAKPAETTALKAWPVVKSAEAEPSAMSAWPVVKSAKP